MPPNDSASPTRRTNNSALTVLVVVSSCFVAALGSLLHVLTATRILPRRTLAATLALGALLPMAPAAADEPGGGTFAKALPCTLTPGPTRVGDPTLPVGDGDRGTGPGPAVRKVLHSDNRWFLDSEGRVAMLHGTNMVRKLAPYTLSSVGFGVDDADAIADAGWNTVRVGFAWKAFEPAPGRYDMDYLADLAGTVELLTKRKIHVLFDAHQDMYNEKFNGQGLPDWATFDDGISATPNCGFPLNYFAMVSMWRAWDHLWANDVVDARGRTLWQAYAQMWRKVAQEFRDDPYVFGYDLFNEPFPGSDYLTCSNPLVGCSKDAVLERFQATAARAIRDVDPYTTIFYEPLVTYDFGAKSSVRNPVGRNAGFSFHSYCLLAQPGLPVIPASGAGCQVLENIPLQSADARRKAYQGAPMLSEFGATDDVAILDRVADNADRHMMSWQHWTWFGEDVSAPRDNESIVMDPAQPPTGPNVHSDKLDALVRPYPQSIAGTPTGFRYDAARRSFSLEYSTLRAEAGAAGRFPAQSETRVFVPRRHFPHGIRVTRLSGASARLEKEILLLRSRPGADRVTVAFTARSG